MLEKNSTSIVAASEESIGVISCEVEESYPPIPEATPSQLIFEAPEAGVAKPRILAMEDDVYCCWCVRGPAHGELRVLGLKTGQKPEKEATDGKTWRRLKCQREPSC